MSREFQTGDPVEWDWGTGTARGEIVEIHTADIEKTIKGTAVKRNASEDEPAFTIRQDDGDTVLKSNSEIRPVK